jgi:hypothetical protein
LLWRSRLEAAIAGAGVQAGSVAGVKRARARIINRKRLEPVIIVAGVKTA